MADFAPEKERSVIIDAPDTIEYRPVSRLAIVACALGAASALGLSSSLFWFVPWLAVAIAVGALWQIQRSPDPMLGRRAAAIGIALAVFFGGWAYSEAFLWRSYLQREAKQNALVWFDLMLNDKIEPAFRLTQSPDQRATPTIADPSDPNPHRVNRYENFLKMESVQSIIDLHGKGKPRFERFVAFEKFGKSDMISLRIQLLSTNHGLIESTPYFVVMERTVNERMREAQWRVEKVERIVSHDPTL